MRDRFDKIVAGMSACLVMVLFAISVAPHAQALDAERRSLLVVELAGANSNADLFALLANLRNTLGSAAFPTSKYTVQPNDTVCSIYRVQSKLPVNSSACPRSAMDLNRALNGKRSSYLRPKEQILIPDIVVESHRQAEIRQSSKGSSSRQKAYRPFTETYLLKIGVTPDIAKQAVEHILKSGMSNVTAYVSDAGLGVTKSLQSANWTSPTSSCLNPASETSQTKDISYFYLFDWLRKDQWPDDSTYDQLKKCALACTESERGSCVDIVLLDAPVSRHSDIEDVVHLLDRDGKETQQSPLAPANACSVDPEFASKDHGTHLASIIASKEDGKGFVGISPGLDIYAYPWDEGTTFDQLRNFIRMRTNMDPEAGETLLDRGAQVFAFASKFPPPSGGSSIYSYDETLLDGSRLKPEYKPWLANALSKTVVGSASSAIWVVAAMQKGQGLVQSEEIFESSGFSPVNLANFPNVIVVSACDHCKDGDAAMWKDAFWSSRLVHVAAPGMNVLAPVGPGRLANAGGTSQATALVAGIVGAMLNCYGGYYTDKELGALKPEKIKQRLQYTSRPLFYDENDLKRVAAGVVDPRAALLDPAEAWVLDRDTTVYRKLLPKPANWCTEKIQLADQSGETKAAFTQNIVRLVRMTSPGTTGDIRPWVIFSLGSLADPDAGATPAARIVERWSPRKLNSPAPEIPLLRLKDGTVLRAKDFDDLILSGPLPNRRCP